MLKDTVNDSALQEQVGYALWEAMKVAVVPSVFRSQKFPPTPSPTPSPSSQSVSHDQKQYVAYREPSGLEVTLKEEGELHQLIVDIPEEFQDMAMEILFREAWEEVSARFGISVSKADLVAKKRAFEVELGKRRAIVKGILFFE